MKKQAVVQVKTVTDQEVSQADEIDEIVTSVIPSPKKAAPVAPPTTASGR